MSTSRLVQAVAELESGQCDAIRYMPPLCSIVLSLSIFFPLYKNNSLSN